jgi:precorrin-2/cobalt-factor-2 C20-methyltransferase
VSQGEAFGVLYGLGVGPGDPGLITIKAAEILGKMDVVFTASASANEDSLAAKIAQRHLRADVPCRKLAFPMTNEKNVLEKAWDQNALAVAEVLRSGRSAAFLTLGDCLTYSTYAYLLRHLARVMPEAKIESVPGVTSYQLAAARLNRPLVQGRETLAVLGGADGPGLEALMESADNLAILKSYRETPEMINRLKVMGLLDRSAICANLALGGETIIDGLEEDPSLPKSYFTLLLVNKRSRD